jgi:hypothetical protein
MKHKQYDFRTAYIDLLLNILTGIIFLFIMTTLLIQPKQKNDDGMKRNAQYIINAEWSKDIDCDVDMWVQDPAGRVVWFQEKDRGIMHIERDDLGFRNDIVYDISGNIIAENTENKETWVLRGKESGTYTVNVHLYACRIEARQLMVSDPVNLPVKLTLIRINPTVKTEHEESVSFKQVWQEITAFNFTLNNNGDVISINHDAKRLLKVKQ